MNTTTIILIGVYFGIGLLVALIMARTSQIKDLGAQLERNWHKLDTLEEQNLLIANTLKMQRT